MSDPADLAEQLFRLVWPDGMPERERVIWDGLLPGVRETVVERLDAVWRAENGEAWKPLAEKIGVSRSSFFNLRKLWRENSLEGLVPFARQTPRRLATADDAPVRALARDVLRNSALASRNVDLARTLLENADPQDVSGSNDQAKVQWAERLIRHERRALSIDKSWLREKWGTSIIVDLTAVSIALKGQSELAVVAVCLDAASGLVLGSAIGRLKVALELERAAVDEAWRFIREHKADRNPKSHSPCNLSLMLPASCDTDRIAHALKGSIGTLEISVPGSYSFGQHIVQLIGPRIGRVGFAPRKTLSISTTDFSRARQVQELDLAIAHSFWLREVLRHNEHVYNALGAAGVINNGCRDGRLSDLFYRLDDAMLKFC